MTALWYVLAKFVAYTAWSAVGIGWFRFKGPVQNGPLSQEAVSTRYSKWLAATGFGFVRLVMGIFFGLLIWLCSSAMFESLPAFSFRDAVIYLVVYVPVRWVEWTILALLIVRGVRKTSWLFDWTDISSRWRLGGIAISCLADIPLIISLGGVIPTGRFLC